MEPAVVTIVRRADHVPEQGATCPNPVGTAGGILFEQEGKYFYVLPGVPYEMKEMIDGSIIPYLATKVKDSVIRHLTLRTSGIPESMLANQLGNLDEILHGAKLAFLPSPTGVRMRISVHGDDAASVERLLSEVEQRIRVRVQKYIYGTNLRIGRDHSNILTAKKLTIAVSESCTGGLVADRITDVSGSSNYFQQGLVTYSNPSKVDVLGVPSLLLEQHGAVSREVAEAMASSIRRVARTDIGLSTTGIAGPTGATSTKPIGLVWIGYSDAEATFATRFQFGGDRRRVKERAAQAALELLRRKLLKIE